MPSYSKIDVDLLSLDIYGYRLQSRLMCHIYRVVTFSDSVAPLPWPVSPNSKYISSTISV